LSLVQVITRKNCFRYLKLMSPLNAAICSTISYTLWVEWYYLKNQLFDLEVKGQGPTKVMTVRDTPPYGYALTYQISLTYLERQNVMAQTRKYYLKNNYLTSRSKSHEGHYGTPHIVLWSCTHIPNIIDLSRKTKKLWSGQASLRRSWSGRKNQTKTICLPS
jgi:hypothetical protein